MEWKERGKRLGSKPSKYGWAFIFLAIWNFVGQIDTTMALPNIVVSIWELISTPQGTIGLFVLGLAFLALLVMEPSFIGRIFGVRESHENLSETVKALEEVPNNVRDHEDRLRSIGDRLSSVEEKIDYLRGKVEPRRLVSDAGEAMKKIVINYKQAVLLMGTIERSITFQFEVINASFVSVQPTGNTEGTLLLDAQRMTGVAWRINWQPPRPAAPNERARLDIVFPISERLAESLAIKVPGTITVEFSEMFVEFEGEDGDHRRQVLGRIALGGSHTLTIRDEAEFQQLRAVVRWKNSLRDDSKSPN